MKFRNKRILFIAPKFHNYESLIKEELENMGAQVDFFPERSYSLAFTFVNNFLKKLLTKYQEVHYNDILASIDGFEYDYLFVIRGFMLPASFLRLFKKTSPNARTIMYQWDAEQTNSFIHLKSEFDIIKTFDFKDSNEFGIPYVPLFYTKDIEELRCTGSKEIKYDFFFMGYFFDERYEGILRFRDFCDKNGYRLKSFLYMPWRTRVKYFFQGKKLDSNIVSFSHMDRKDYLSLLYNSHVMVDVSNPKQTGLAMRVIESLACGTKVLTSNDNFKKDGVLASSNAILHFDLENICIEKRFLDENLQVNLTLVLSINRWLITIFDDYED